MVFANPINVKASLEPLKGLKIDISATRMNTRNKSEYYISDASGNFDAMNTLYTGNFSVSFLSIGTAFWKFGENYSSKAYDLFKDYRQAVAWRLATDRSNARLSGSPLYNINDPNLDPITGDPLNDGYPNGYGPLSQEVLIPAFMAAYGGKSAESVSLSPFPKFPLPNWRITYDGLTELDFIRKFISNISLTHSYTSTYNIGSFTTNAAYNWDEEEYDGFSWTRDQVNELFIPEQEINSINIGEAFNPLISADITWINNLSSKLELRKGRNMTLSFSNNQLIDLITSEIIIGLGYRFDQLPIIIKTGKGNQQKFQSDLNLRGDFSIIDMLTIIRKVKEDVDQITAGQKGLSLKLSADYALNERFNLKLFYDHTVVSPRISTSFKTSNVKFGVSVRFSLIP
jgi:cell surface protein SprA